MQKRTRVVRIISIAVACLLVSAVLGVGILFAYTRLPYADYYDSAERAFEIPGFRDGFVAQGLAYDDAGNFFVCGYDTHDGPSSVYCIGSDSVKRVLLKNEKGEMFSGHCGGIACHGEYLYVAGSGKSCVFVLRYADIQGAADGEYVSFCARIPMGLDSQDGIRVSLAGGDGDRLLVGEYYRAHSYETPDSHKFVCGGQSFGALMLEYSYNSDAEWGISPVPTAVYSIPDDVQGATFDENGDIYFSTSGGYGASHILKYSIAELKRAEDIPLGDGTLPHYLTIDSARRGAYKNPPMSEEIVIVNGKLYIMNEYSSSKFWLGRFSGARYCYAIDLNKIDNTQM